MSTRIKANALKLTIDGVDYWADLSQAELVSEEASSDVTTFAEAAQNGASDWYFTVSGIQSTDATSFWMAMWDNAGDEVEYTFAPHGNATATVAQPHFRSLDNTSPLSLPVSYVRLPRRGSLPIGGEAAPDGTFSFSGIRMDIIGEPFKATAAPND
jgi:hypothetical protein